MPFQIPVLLSHPCAGGSCGGWGAVWGDPLQRQLLFPEGNSPKKGGSCESVTGKQVTLVASEGGPAKGARVGTTASPPLSTGQQPRGSTPPLQEKG